MAELEGLVTTEGRVLTSKGPIAREVKFLVYATVMLYAVLVSVIAFGAIYLVRNQNTNHRLGQAGQDVHQAICVLRADLVQRVVSNRIYLRDHPSGFLGIPAAVIASGLQQQQQTIDALDSLHCK